MKNIEIIGWALITAGSIWAIHRICFTDRYAKKYTDNDPIRKTSKDKTGDRVS